MPSNAVIARKLDKLKAQLQISGLQQENLPLFQVINQLIDALKDVASDTATTTGGGSGGGGLSNQNYLTSQDNLATLPNSRQLIAGNRVVFDDATFGERTVDVDVADIESAEVLTAADETATFPNSRQLLAGDGVAFDDSVANERTISATGIDRQWSVLTNGDVDNPELIFAGGEVIMTHIP